MKNQPKTPRRLAWLATIAAACAAAAPALPAFAQAKAAAAAKGAAGAAAAAVKQGLDGLDDKKLQAELANRGLDNLLTYYFQKNNVPDDQRKEIVVLIALKNLDSPEFSRKSMAERKDEIQKIVDGINSILPTITEPERLLRYAAGLVTNGTLRSVNTLEYWGDNPKTQATLNPVAETVDKIYAQAIGLTKADAEKYLNLIKADGDANYKKWEVSENLTRTASYQRANAAYGLALSYDKAAAEKRGQVCKDAIAILKDFEQFDNVKLQAQLMIAKLSMVMGGDEGYKQAKDYFKQVQDAKGDNIAAMQYQARYFSLVADLLAHKPDEAAKGLPELQKWQQEALPADAQKGAEAAYSMLEYRVLAARSDAAPDAAAKEKINADAVAVLMDLVAKRPDLRSVIFEQVMSKIPDKPKLAELNPLLLEALVTRGIDALQHKALEKDDSRNIQVAADAAREIVKRKGQPGISAAQVDLSAYTVGIFEERIGSAADLAPDDQRTNKADAAEAFVGYVKNFAANPVRVENSLDHALPLLLQLRKEMGNDDRVNRVYDDFLDLALKNNRTNLAYAYAMRRKEVQDYANARRGFMLVKSDKPGVEIMRRYYQMFCDQQLISKSADAATKQSLTAEILKLADELNPLLDTQIAALQGNKTQIQFVRLKVQMVLLAADVARANKDSKAIVSLLAGFEDRIKILPAEEQNQFLGIALFLRVNAMIALGQSKEALGEVQKLVATQAPDQSLQTITALLEQLNASYNLEHGKDQPDMGTLQILSQQRAQLAALLVEQVQKNPKMPDENKRAYVKFNATAQRQAAALEPDKAKKNQYVEAAIKQYREQEKGIAPDTSEYSALEREVALAEYEKGTVDGYQSCHDTLMGLFAAKKFGSALTRPDDNGDSKPNEVYWEALLRLVQCKVQLAKLKNDPAYLNDPKEGAKYILANFAVIPFGDQAGGDAYAKDFRALRKEVLGDWKPTDAPATQPVAGG